MRTWIWASTSASYAFRSNLPLVRYGVLMAVPTQTTVSDRGMLSVRTCKLSVGQHGVCMAANGGHMQVWVDGYKERQGKERQGTGDEVTRCHKVAGQVELLQLHVATVYTKTRAKLPEQG